MTTPLRPLNLGELLDRSFFLYRKHFLLFVGIIGVPYLCLLAFQLVGVVIAPQTPGGSVLYFVWALGAIVLSLAAAAASHGATVVAVSKVHLGGTISVSDAFAGIKGRILGLVGVMIGLGFGIGIGFMLLLIPGIILSLMWALTIPVAVVENRGLVDSVARSSDLTKGSRGRVFVIYFLFAVLFYIVLMVCLLPLLYMLGSFVKDHGAGVVPIWYQAGAPVGTFLTECLVGPLMTIGLSLLYYDQRVRKEGFDLQHMMASLESPQGPQSEAPAAAF